MDNIVIHVTTVDSTVRFLLFPFLNYLQKTGYDVSVACKEYQEQSDLKRENFKINKIYNFTRNMSPIQDCFALCELIILFYRVKPTIVHTHTPKANFLGRLAALLTGVPIVIGMEHGFYFLNMTGLSRMFYTALSRLGAYISDKTIVINQYDFDLALRERIIEKDKIVFSPIGLGVNLARFKIEVDRNELLESLAIDEDTFIVIFVGRINAEKGCRELIKAIRILDFEKFCLLMVGPDENGLEKELKELVSSWNLQNNVRFLGQREDIPQLLAISDLLVLPSHREGLGMVLLEASAAGKPVVASNIRGCRDAVIHGETGLLFQPYSVQEIADSISDLIHDPKKCKRMGEASRRMAEEKFDENIFFAQMSDLYTQLLKEKGIC